MGRPPEVEVRPGTAVAIATGAPLPPGADAVLKIEHTQARDAGVARGAPSRDTRRGNGARRRGRRPRRRAGPRRPPTARPGPRHAGRRRLHGDPGPRPPPRGDRVDRRRARAARRDPTLAVGQVRDSSAPALAALVREAGGDPHFAGIVPDDREALSQALRATLNLEGSDPSRVVEGSLRGCDVLVVSAGSSVGARDETAAAIASLGEPGIWCHGLAFRPGKPTLLADCGGVPVIGLPGNPRSALVVFRLIGIPIVRLVGGCTEPPPEPTVRARLARDLPSAAGRLDVVQVRLDGRRGRAPLRQLLAALDPHCCRRLRRRSRGRHRPRGRHRQSRSPCTASGAGAPPGQDTRLGRMSAWPAPRHSSTTAPPPRRSPPGRRRARRPAARSGSRPCGFRSTRPSGV